MIDAALERVPVEHRFNAVWILLALAVFTAGYAANMFQREHVVTRTVKVERSWGTPSQSVPGVQVNSALSGLVCDVYASRKTVVCHP
jgi:hypothetical protein